MRLSIVRHKKRRLCGAFPVLAAIFILFGSYLLQLLGAVYLNFRSESFFRSSTCRLNKLAVVDHRLKKVATIFLHYLMYQPAILPVQPLKQIHGQPVQITSGYFLQLGYAICHCGGILSGPICEISFKPCPESSKA